MVHILVSALRHQMYLVQLPEVDLHFYRPGTNIFLKTHRRRCDLFKIRAQSNTNGEIDSYVKYCHYVGATAICSSNGLLFITAISTVADLPRYDYCRGHTSVFLTIYWNTILIRVNETSI